MPRKVAEKESESKIKTSVEMRSLIVTILLIGLIMFFITFASLVLLINQSKKLDSISDEIASMEKSGGSKSADSEGSSEYDVSMFKSLSGKEAYDYLKDSNGYKVFYSGRETCTYCVKFLPHLQKSLEEYDIEVVYVDLTKMSGEDYDALGQFGGILRQYDQNCTPESGANIWDSNYCGRIGSTPIMIIFKDGKVVGGQFGYAEYDTWKSELDRAKVNKR